MRIKLRGPLTFASGLISLMFVAGACLARTFDPPLPMVVKVPVADVRTQPTSRTPDAGYDPLQETQVEAGEPVLVFERKGAWARVEAPDQMEYTHNNRWQGYPGWVLWSSLTRDVRRLKEIKKPDIPEDALRDLILSEGDRHLGTAYVWGGRSLYDPSNKAVVTGVDCSGLVNWAYRRAGVIVPRDAHEQWMRARPLEPEALKPADLIFLAKTDNPNRIVHVMMVAGGDELLEAPQTGETVRRISFAERFGRPLSGLKNGQEIGDRVISFGRLFATE